MTPLLYWRNDVDRVMSQIRTAYIFGKGCHDEVKQVRKYTGEPYFEAHCVPVAMMVAEFCVGEDQFPHMVRAALLHDVVEDTDAELNDVWFAAGGTTAWFVDWLTNPVSLGNRAARMAVIVDRWRWAPREAQLIKLADLIDNTWSIAKHDPKFAKVYVTEKRALLGALDKTTEHPLRWQAQATLRAAEIQLGRK